MSDSAQQNVDLLESVLDKTGTIVAGIRPEQHALPTPCPDFDVQKELAHVLGWVEFFACSAEDREPEADPRQATAPADAAAAAEQLRAAAKRAVAAFRDGATQKKLRMTQGELDGESVVGMMLMEYVGHGWDLATATGQDAPYTDEEVDAAHVAAQAMLLPEYRGPDSFREMVSVPDDAPALDRLLGFLGRDPNVEPVGA